MKIAGLEPLSPIGTPDGETNSLAGTPQQLLLKAAGINRRASRSSMDKGANRRASNGTVEEADAAGELGLELDDGEVSDWHKLERVLGMDAERRNVKELRLLEQYMRRSPLLAKMPLHCRLQLAKKARADKRELGSVVVRKGDTNSTAYVVIKGRVSLTNTAGDIPGGRKARVVGERHEGDWFGEGALTHLQAMQPHTCTVTDTGSPSTLTATATATAAVTPDAHSGKAAATYCLLLAVDKQSLQSLLSTGPNTALPKYANVAITASLWAPAKEVEVRVWLLHWQERRYKRGEVILRQGAAAKQAMVKLS